MSKSTYSESTKQLAVAEGEGNKGIGENFDMSSQRSASETDNIALREFQKDVNAAKGESQCKNISY